MPGITAKWTSVSLRVLAQAVPQRLIDLGSSRHVKLVSVVSLFVMHWFKRQYLNYLGLSKSTTNVLHINDNDKRLQRIAQGCSTLHETYRPPWWCVGPWMNIFTMLIKERLAPKMPLHRDTIICADGGEVSIDWATDAVTLKLPQDAPILVILHTISGNSWQQAGFMHYAAQRGWRSCVFNRRGHSGMPLRVPHFSIMGNVDDTVVMVNKIRKQYPDNFLALAGISAGSGACVSYIGREGNKAPVDAAASLCPAWDLSSAFLVLEKRFPWMDRHLTKNVKELFLGSEHNQKALATMPEAVAAAQKTTHLSEFMIAAAPLAGCRDGDHYYKVNNPMEYIYGNKTPCLVLNAMDDFLCLKENVRVDLPKKIHNYLLVMTEEGSHIAFNEGMFGGGNYMWRLSLDFFETVKLDQDAAKELSSPSVSLLRND